MNDSLPAAHQAAGAGPQFVSGSHGTGTDGVTRYLLAFEARAKPHPKGGGDGGDDATKSYGEGRCTGGVAELDSKRNSG